MKVYAVPLVKPVTVVETPAGFKPPHPPQAGLGMTVYDVGAVPPTGAVHDTIAWVLPAVALTPVGAPGGPAVGVTELDAPDGLPVPTALVAFTVKVYAVPLVRP